MTLKTVLHANKWHHWCKVFSESCFPIKFEKSCQICDYFLNTSLSTEKVFDCWNQRRNVPPHPSSHPKPRPRLHRVNLITLFYLYWQMLSGARSSLVITANAFWGSFCVITRTTVMTTATNEDAVSRLVHLLWFHDFHHSYGLGIFRICTITYHWLARMVRPGTSVCHVRI